MKLAKLRIKNFRTIGLGNEGTGIEIDMMSNDLIFILGKNNAGKSSILNAYDYFVNDLIIQENDFYGKNLKLQIEIEVQLKADSDEERQLDFFDQSGITSIKKIWEWKTNPENHSDKSTFILFAGEWKKVEDEKGKKAFKVLQREFPETIWIRGMATSQETVDNLKKLVQKVVLQSLKSSQEYLAAQDAIQKLQELVSNSKDSEKISMSIARVMQEVFPGISIKIDSFSQNIDLIKVIQDDTTFLIEEDNITVPHNMQGHGVQRQLIFSALKEYSKQLKQARSSSAKSISLDSDKSSQSIRKQYIILLEEPELFLHPTAIRSVRNLLYDLAKNSEFQIICATHSPIVIDLSQSQNSLVRIVKNPEIGSISHQVQKEELIAPRMLETFNPHVCESFFADQVILVEGSTEAIAIRKVLDKLESSKNMKAFHIVNCGGKTTIPEFQRILRLFRINYHVFHDSDSSMDKNGKPLNVWKINEKIWKEIEMARKCGIQAKRFVSIVNFESANGYSPHPQSKPTEAYKQVMAWVNHWHEETIQEKPIVKYVRSLVSGSNDIEDHTQAWLMQQNIEDVPANFIDEQLDLFPDLQ